MILNEASDSKYITLTVEWLKQAYDEMNTQLFRNELGACLLGIFTTGKGANGNVLGWFKMTGSNLYYSKSTRKIYTIGSYLHDKIYVDRKNFVQICKPKIELNGNYQWSEKAALSTLVHEMCHYYCNMFGYRPLQHHGSDFKEIAAIISSRSNGIFTVQRIASAEQMDEMTLNTDIQAKNQKRIENKQSKVELYFVFMKDGQIRLVNSTNDTVLDNIISLAKKANNVIKVLYSVDPNLKKLLVNEGYSKTCRTYRFYDITNDEWVKTLGNYDVKQVYGFENTTPKPTVVPTPTPTKPSTPLIPLFRLQTAQGNTFELRNVTKQELEQKLRERFPKWSDEVIQKVIQNNKYYPNK